MDVPDADFQVSLYEILADGRIVALSFDLMRARYRESLREAKLVVENEPARYEFSGFNFIARRIAAGNRLRAIVTCPNNLAVQKNYCSGRAVASESGADARVATIKLLRDQEHHSYLSVPVIPQR